MRILFLLLILFFVSPAQSQELFSTDHYFLAGGVLKIRAQKDTLYHYKCYSNGACLLRYYKHYKILSISKSGAYFISKLQRLDSIPLTPDPFPATRYSIAISKKIDSLSLAYYQKDGFTLAEVQSFDINPDTLTQKFFFTYFSEAAVTDFMKRKKVTTKEQAIEIMELLKTPAFKERVMAYGKTDIPSDLYYAALAGELIVQACILKGYNPVGVQEQINYLLQ